MKLVIDSSVAVKFAIPEPGQREAHELLRSSAERIAPALLMLETANTLWKKVGRKELSEEQASVALDLVEDSISRFVDEKDYAHAALDLALQIAHPVYDCTYLAVAEMEEAPFVTADMKLVNKLNTTAYGRWVRPLTQII